VTPSPTDSTIPAPSCPRTIGKAPSGSFPESVYASAKTIRFQFHTNVQMNNAYQCGKHQCSESQSELREPLVLRPQCPQLSNPSPPPTQPQPSKQSVSMASKRGILRVTNLTSDGLSKAMVSANSPQCSHWVI
jgi:hypothetical protein